MKILRSLAVAVVALTACSGSTVIQSVTPPGGDDSNAASAPTTRDAPVDVDPPETVDADEADPAVAEPPKPATVSDLDVLLALDDLVNETSPTADANQLVQPDDWCAGGAERMRTAFAATLWADRGNGTTLEQALTALLGVLIEVQPIAPEEIQQAFSDAIETQIEVNAALDAVGWDRSIIDWSTVEGLRLNEEATTAIDIYGSSRCGLRPGYLLPESGAPASREDNDEFEDLIEVLVVHYRLDTTEARCLAQVFFEYGVTPSSEVREEINACGVSPRELREIASGQR